MQRLYQEARNFGLSLLGPERTNVKDLGLLNLLHSYRQFEASPIAEIFAKPRVIETIQQAPLAMVAILGPSATGKTTLLRYIQETTAAEELLTRIITTTTRPPRSQEIPGDHYHFLSPEAFRESQQAGVFIESVRQGKHHYGTSETALHQAIKTAQQQASTKAVVWTGDIVGLPTLKTWMQHHYPQIPFITGFILPDLNAIEYLAHLYSQRGAIEAVRRFLRATWEVVLAGTQADLIIHNHFNPTGAEQTAQSIIQLFRLVGSNPQHP